MEELRWVTTVMPEYVDHGPLVAGPFLLPKESFKKFDKVHVIITKFDKPVEDVKDEVIQYIMVNSSLKMNKGKVAAQVAHSAVKAASHAEKLANHDHYEKVYRKWYEGSYTKIILKVNEYEMKEIIKKYRGIIHETYDEGRTQIQKGSLTTAAFIPLEKSEVPEELKKLKLL